VIETERLPRRLAVIVYADVAEYSRLTGEDEDTTHRRLSEYLELIASNIESHRGKVMHYAGDAVLSRFDAVVDALSAAVAIQNILSKKNQGLPDERKVQFRIGINLGDVIEDRDDIYGDGVNVAARLESLAQPGGICISEAVYTAVGNKLALTYKDIGKQQVKNIAKPVQAYFVFPYDAGATPEIHRAKGRRWLLLATSFVLIIVAAAGMWFLINQETESTDSQSTVEVEQIEKREISQPSALPDASIAVLPFTNVSNDPDEDYYIDGITRDIITDLSRLSGLFVIASNSVFTYKGVPVKVQEVGRELGVKYVLEGSIQRSGDRVRINAQLVNAESGHHLWAERFDRQLTDIFALQDEVSQRIVSALAVNLTPNEEASLSESMQTNPEAYDLLLRGLGLFRRFTRETNAEARYYFKRAIALEPDFARAHADIALSLSMDIQFNWELPTEAIVEEALAHSQKALELNPNVRQVHFALCSVYTVLKEHDKAISAGREAIRVDPNYADGYANLAQALTYAGRPEEALEAMASAIRLNPRYAFFYTWIIGHALMLQGNYDEAIIKFEEVIERNAFFPGALLTLAAIYGNIGPSDEAEWKAAEILVLQPDFSIALEMEQVPYKLKRHTDWYINGLRNAGLPE